MMIDETANVETSRTASKMSTHSNSSPPGAPVTRLIDGMNAAMRAAIALLLAGMSICAMIQVIVRLVLDTMGANFSVPWTEELSRYMMVWLIFLGAAYACRGAQLISLTIVVDRLSGRLQAAATTICALLCVAFYALLVQVGISAFRTGFIEMSPVLQFPKAYVYAAMPVGAAAMIINTLAFLAENRGWIGRPAGDAAPDQTP
jgi:TRAP-type C4-dicarboxylate transport system permease small subunit